MNKNNFIKAALMASAWLMATATMADDLTGMGQNMSFEDLSSQGGQQTSTVCGAPTGWNTFVNGQQVTTEVDVRNAGITAWFGINDDCDGEGKDGNYGFGLWNSAIPDFELSQTIDGLQNGTYIVRAGLMVGANDNGSRRTTQRIFGNLNARFFASEDEYDADRLRQTEISSFEGLEEPITDRELQEMTLRVFVYDGTLTFGLRTDGNIAAALRYEGNPAGGDGWFKVDNFRIETADFEPEDAIAIFNRYQQLLSGIETWNLPAIIAEEIDRLLNLPIDASSSLAECAEAVNAITSCYEKSLSVSDAYTRLELALDKAFRAMDVYEADYKSLNIATIETAADALINLIDEAYELLDAPTYDIAQADDLTSKIIEAAALLLKVCNPLSIASNLSFEDISAQGGQQTSSVAAVPAGWNAYINGRRVTTADEVRGAGVTGWFGVNDDCDGEGKDGSYGFGLWNRNVPDFEISQTVDGLENGTYIVTAGLMVGANDADSRRTTQRIFGNLNSSYYGAQSDYDLSALDQGEVYAFSGQEETVTDRELKNVSARVFVYDGTLTFGLRTDGNLAAANRYDANPSGGDGWFKVDNFRIVQTDYQPEDALSIYQHFMAQDELLATMTIQNSLKATLQTLKQTSVGAGSNMDEIIEVIKSSHSLYLEMQASQKAYDMLAKGIDEATDEYYNYEAYFKADANTERDAAAEALQITTSEASKMLSDAEADNSQVDDMRVRLRKAVLALRMLCVAEPLIFVDDVMEWSYYNFNDWNGHWYNQGDNLDKDVSAYDYVWIKYSEATSSIAFGIIYNEWVKTESWGESYYTDSAILPEGDGIVGIKLEKNKTCKTWINNAESPYLDDIYAMHVRQVFLQSQGVESALNVEGIWYGTTEEYLKMGGTENAVIMPTVKAATTSTAYNLSGQRIGKGYKGIVIAGGRKYLQK